MKHYPHHIGDFDRATRHLTRIERSVYSDLLDVYYDTERQLVLDVQALVRKIVARTSEEATAVEQVLNEFFTKTPTGWYHDRCEEVISKYRSNKGVKSAAGRASAEAKKTKREQALLGRSTPVEQMLISVETKQQQDGSIAPASLQLTNNQEPITKNQEPKETKNRAGKKPPALDFLVDIKLPEWLPKDSWDDFVQHRKSGKSPLTLKAAQLSLSKLEALMAEGHKPKDVIEHSIMSGWTGLFAPPKSFSPKATPQLSRHNDFDKRDYKAGEQIPDWMRADPEAEIAS